MVFLFVCISECIEIYVYVKTMYDYLLQQMLYSLKFPMIWDT